MKCAVCLRFGMCVWCVFEVCYVCLRCAHWAMMCAPWTCVFEGALCVWCVVGVSDVCLRCAICVWGVICVFVECYVCLWSAHVCLRCALCVWGVPWCIRCVWGMLCVSVCLRCALCVWGVLCVFEVCVYNLCYVCYMFLRCALCVWGVPVCIRCDWGMLCVSVCLRWALCVWGVYHVFCVSEVCSVCLRCALCVLSLWAVPVRPVYVCASIVTLHSLWFNCEVHTLHGNELVLLSLLLVCMARIYTSISLIMYIYRVIGSYYTYLCGFNN